MEKTGCHEDTAIATQTDQTKDTAPARRRRGFEQAGGLVAAPIRKASESRGFAVVRLLTHWPEIVGAEVARVSRPQKVSWSQGGMGGTLVILADGAHAPLIQMQEARIRDRVNACYGHAAIARIRVVQTAPDMDARPATGFAEPAAPFAGAAPAERPLERPLAPDLADRLSGIRDPDLRAQLAAMGGRVRPVVSREKRV
jgi:hypothetical protein